MNCLDTSTAAKWRPHLREQLVEQRDDLLVLAGEVVELHALLEHPPPLGVGRDGLDHLQRWEEVMNDRGSFYG